MRDLGCRSTWSKPCSHRSTQQGCKVRILKKQLKEPLLHFLILGGLIFALNTWRDAARPAKIESTHIEVTAAVIERLRAGYERQFGQAPDETELRGLVTAHIREEVLYREALAMGLDRDDYC